MPRIARNSNPDASDYEEIPLDALEDEDVSESVDTSDNSLKTIRNFMKKLRQ
ncbi:hypothetical protein BN1095_4580002 [Clostridioides difficile]|uniref:Uncharacterized protein n=1 Tax=Clostridioides difficile TaxID=1496 RepID=A0A069AXP0_CLODI|nr:hypothetical protein BN1095_4580002 [Clostridioides difficile]